MGGVIVHPGLVHEERVALLGQMSRLAGCTMPCTVGLGLHPDVLLAHPSLRLVFLGEAKSSETPGNAETERRLRRYLRALRRLQRHGCGARMALCGDPHESMRWSRQLRHLAVSERVQVSALGRAELSCGEQVIWLDLLPASGESPRLASPQSWPRPA